MTPKHKLADLLRTLIKLDEKYADRNHEITLKELEANLPKPKLDYYLGQIIVNIVSGTIIKYHPDRSSGTYRTITTREAGNQPMQHLLGGIREALKYTHDTNAHAHLQRAMETHIELSK